MDLNFNIVSSNLPTLWQGLQITVASFLLALAIGLPLGALLTLCRLRRAGAIERAARTYVTLFRAIPEMVLIFWMYYCLPVLTASKISGFWSGSIGLGFVAAAFLCEVFRGGVNAVPKGQWEAANALALPRTALWFRIIVPQAARLSLPPFINYMTELLKATTLLATIGVADLALQAYLLGAQTFRYFEFLTAIAVVYFVVIFPIARFSEHMERRLAGEKG
ncbi:MAG: amino acid ABC transporter permease [Rhizobiaceae bacterium]